MATPPTTTSLDVQALRARFPALARPGPDGRPFVWADAPGGSQAPESVIAAIADRMRAGASNTHGAFPLSAEVDALIDRAHRAGADFLGCDRDEVVFGQNATSLLLHVSRSFARTLRPGDEVVVTRLDHDANVRPWVLAARDAGATVRWVDVRADDVTLDVDSFDAQLSERTRLVAFTLASNAVGTVPPAADLIARAKAVGALVALDGVHAAQHRLIDLHGLGADLVATSPYKFFGPHQGMLGVRRELLETWEPYKLRPVEDVEPGSVGDRHAEPRGDGGDRRRDRVHRRRGRRRRDAARRDRGVVRRVRGPRTRALATVPRRRRGDRGCPAGRDRRSRAGGRAHADVRGARRASSRRPRLRARWPIWASSRGRATTTRSRSSTGSGSFGSGGAVRIGFCHYHTLDEVDRVLDALEVVGRRS